MATAPRYFLVEVGGSDRRENRGHHSHTRLTVLARKPVRWLCLLVLFCLAHRTLPPSSAPHFTLLRPVPETVEGTTAKGLWH